jgi:hypothetical protein
MMTLWRGVAAICLPGVLVSVQVHRRIFGFALGVQHSRLHGKGCELRREVFGGAAAVRGWWGRRRVQRMDTKGLNVAAATLMILYVV